MMSDDLAMRSADIRWPAGFSPDSADLFAHNEIFIHAPRSAVWRHIVEAENWPRWYPSCRDVRVSTDPTGELREGSRFEWDTFGLHIHSRVSEFVADSRIGWFADGAGLNAYHAWLLADMANGCHVIMEEVQKGPGALALRASDPDRVHQGHDLWLTRLKHLSEGSRLMRPSVLD
jgi:uncharacterized protein YndB with AHSA1/START domain